MSLQWRDIQGFENCYQVSNTGRVRSLDRQRVNRVIPGQEMTLQVHTNGYQVIKLRRPGVYKKFFIHRLVAIHFIKMIEGKDYVNHKDKDRLNNHIDNLEWVDHCENCFHRDNYKPDNDHNGHIPF